MALNSATDKRPPNSRVAVVDNTALPFDLALSKGVIQDAGFVVKFGYNLDIDQNVEETVWAVGGEWSPTAGAELVDIVSSSAQDANTTGTGAWIVLITGLDADYNEVEEFVNLNGTNTVQTTTAYRYINQVAVAFSGSSNFNVGNITFNQTTSGDSLAYIPAEESVTQQVVYTVPNGFRGYLAGTLINIGKTSSGSNPKVTCEIYSYNPDSLTRYNIETLVIDAQVQNSIFIPSPFANQLDQKTTFYVNATSDTNNTIVYARFFMRLVKI